MSRKLLAPLVCLLAFAPTASAADVETVRVNFAKPRPISSMVGFLHGMDSLRPGHDRIAPLRPAMWRGYEPVQRVQTVGGRYTLVVSDFWGYPGRGARRPYDNYGRWYLFVRRLAQAHRDENLIWDIWNEPDHEYFWQGTREQLYETYRVAWQALHDELGDRAWVAGPSTSIWRRDWLIGLLDWCSFHGCEVNVLNWHELDGGSIPAIAEHVRDAREHMLESSRYGALMIREIHVNETISAPDQYRPGEMLGTMQYLEAGGADASARACWDDGRGTDNCLNDTLDGLLTPDTLEPRSTWWATKAYADGAGSRALTRFGDPHVVGLGSSAADRPDSAQLLIAHLEQRPDPRSGGRSEVHVRVTLRDLEALQFLRGRRRVHVEIEKFPDRGALPMSAPRRRRSTTVKIEDGKASFTLHHVRVHEAYRLRFSAP
jgi:xylan 1,4-beta-xylosidase